MNGRRVIVSGGGSAAAGAVGEHATDTTNVHGVADTAVLETTTGAQAKANTAANAVATAAGSALDDHATETTNVHGIANTAVLETTTGAQAKADAAVTAAGTLVANAIRPNLAGGRVPIATRLASPAGTLQPAQNTPLGSTIRHVAAADCTDIVVGFGAPLVGEADGSGNPQIVSTLLKVNNVNYPVFFGGQETGRWDPGGPMVLSDPVPVSLTAGEVFYTATTVSTDSGSTTLAAAANAADTTIQLNALPGGGRGYVGRMAIEGPREVITVKSYAGTAAPYTATLAAGLGSAHAQNAVVGGTVWANITIRNDLNEYPGGNASTTLAAAAAIGDSTIQITSMPHALGTNWTIEGEAVVVRTISGGANPYTVYLTSPLTAAHAQGVTVFGQAGTGVGVAPNIIVANVVRSTPKPTLLIIGDSIPHGTGYYLYPDQSYIVDAANAENRPCLRVSKAGESAQQFAVLATSRRRRMLFSLAKWAYYTYGVNDAYGNRTLAQMQGDTTTILTEVRRRGLKVAIETLPPRTTSIDFFTTTANQTVVNAGTHNQVRIQYNNWLRTTAAGGLADLVVERADTVETARDSGLWKVGAGGPYTMDGIHLSYAGHKLMQPVAAAALAQML